MEFNLIVYDHKLIMSFILIFILSIIFVLRKKSSLKNKIESSSEDIMNHLSSELKIKYDLIETEDSLIALVCEILNNDVSKIGLDTEYYKGNHYQGNLCLFQISYNLKSNKKIFIIDLLKFERNFIKNNFEKILNNEKIEKIIHASENDIEWIYEDYGIFVKNIFDTQEIFTHLSGSSKRVGLNYLLNYYFNLNLEKQTKKYFQTSNWKQRPLLKEQLDYAALDTLYLIDIREKIYSDLKDKMNIIKYKKKKRLVENADSLITDFLKVETKLEKNLDDYKTKIFNLIDFDEIHKNSDYDKIIASTKLKLNQKFKKKLLLNNRAQRNEEKALVYFFNNLVKCETTKASYIRKMFLDMFHFNEEFASKNNINPEKIVNIKIIFKLINAHPDNYNIFEKILFEDTNSMLNENFSDLFNEYKKNLYELLQKVIKEEKTFISNPQISERIDSNQQKDISLKKPKLDRTKKTKVEKPQKESKDVKMDKIIKKFSCKKPVYENCKMLAPDGEMLCFCDKRKMFWYLERDLAEQIEFDPPTFKLKFEPNSRGCVDEGNKKSDFYTTDRRNCCVVCGIEKNYMRFYIIPVIYRTYLPHYLKSHKSHDVLLLCFNCHEKANKLYDVRKKELAVKYDCPLNSLSDEQKTLKIVSKLKRNAEIMIKNLNKLPYDRKNDLGSEILECFMNNAENDFYENFFLNVLINKQNDNHNYNKTKNENEYYENEDEISDSENVGGFNNKKILKTIKFPNKIDDLTEEILLRIAKFDLKKLQIGDKKSMHGKLVIEKIKNQYEEFIKSWREYFIKVMEPKYLPDAWNINHQFQRTFGEYSKFSKESYNSANH